MEFGGSAITVTAWIVALVLIALLGSWVWRLTATFRNSAARIAVTAGVVVVGFPLLLYTLLIVLVSTFF